MKASVQFPPYKAQMVNMNYDQWREAASPSPRPEDGGGGGVRTMVEHFSGEEERRAGTRTVTRHIELSTELIEIIHWWLAACQCQLIISRKIPLTAPHQDHHPHGRARRVRVAEQRQVQDDVQAAAEQQERRS